MQHLGEVIRQVRRLRNLSQQELAGERFSKSYVSAIEHNRAKPSAEALHYFAQRLGQPDGDFAALLEQPEVTKALTTLKAQPPAAMNGLLKRDEALALLFALLEQADVTGASPLTQLPALSPESLASLPSRLQARYHFLMGLAARREDNLSAAIHAFEAALALSPLDQQASILDELGRCHFLQRSYLTALGYHLHARLLLEQLPVRRIQTALRLSVNLHCGETYQALGAYPQALASYESARKHLSAQHDVATAAQVYTGLGYLIYAALFPDTMPFHFSRRSSEQIEHEFQRARSFSLQGASFYQTSGDRLGEANARLMLVSHLLDWSRWRRRTFQAQARGAGEKHAAFATCQSLLEDAREQCRQVLLGCGVPGTQREEHSAELDHILYLALAYLIRAAVQRAALARHEGNFLDMAYRERAFAAYLCQQVLETLANPSPPWELVRQTHAHSLDSTPYRTPAPPHIDDISTGSGVLSPRSTRSLVDIYYAAGEVAEELGRAALVPSYAHDCYMQANRSFHAALALAHTLRQRGECDPGFLTRLYARCISLLEERASASPDLVEETTRALLEVLRQGFWQLQNPLTESEAPGEQSDKEEH